MMLIINRGIYDLFVSAWTPEVYELFMAGTQFKTTINNIIDGYMMQTLHWFLPFHSIQTI